MFRRLSESIEGSTLGLLALFGRDTTPLLPGGSKDARRHGSDAIESLFGDMHGKAAGLYPNMSRNEYMKLLEDMDSTGLASSVLDMQTADTLVSGDDDGGIIRIENGPPAIRREVKSMFHDLRMEERLPRIVRDMCLYGSTFPRLVYSSESGVTHAVPTDTTKVAIRKDKYTDEIIGYEYDRSTFRGNKSKVSWPWDFVHFKIDGKSRTEPYGASVLTGGIRAWTQMVMAEDMALLYRLRRMPDRLLFEIDVGDASEAEAWRQIQEFKRKWRKRIVIDPTLQSIQNEWNPLTLVEDIFIGKRPNSQTKIDTLQGSSNVNDMADVTYYVKQFLNGVDMPPATFGYEEQSSGNPYYRNKRVTNQDVRYARHIRHLQRCVAAALYRMAEIHLYLLGSSNPSLLNYLGDDVGKNALLIDLHPPSWLIELERLEVMRTRTEIADLMVTLGSNTGSMKSYEWTVYILKDIMRIPDHVISSIVKKPAPDEEQTDFGPTGSANAPKPAAKGSRSDNGDSLAKGVPASSPAEDNPIYYANGDISGSEKAEVEYLLEQNPRLRSRLKRLAELVA